MKAPEIVGKLADVEQLLGPESERGETDDEEVLALIKKHGQLNQKWHDIQDELEKLRKRVREIFFVQPHAFSKTLDIFNKPL